MPAGSAQDAVNAFINAWRSGDELSARSIATPQMVDTLFAVAAPRALQSRGCNRPPADAPVRCVYRSDASDEIVVQATPAYGGGWFVDLVTVTPAE
jgi:hypothetical protein